MELKNVTRYIPDDPDYDNNFLYFRSEDGQDFYESLNKFTKRYKLCIDSEGVIRSVSEDVSRLYPAGFSVVEVNKLPAGFNIYGDWKYSNGAVVAVPVDYQDKAEVTRQKLLNDANITIADWRTELALDEISDIKRRYKNIPEIIINTRQSIIKRSADVTGFCLWIEWV
ncbi:TPA: tail fiber assembly protein [Salmonella enterica subsp. enterica serovar Ball]|nr:tail fiber assembly protein [Salmonella enterica subsp. enterica serovar Ball]